MKTNRDSIVLIFAVTLAGCGGAAYAATSEESSTASGGEAVGGGAETMMVELTPEEQELVTEYPDQAELLIGDLDEAWEASTPNCDRAGEIRDAICDLAERICDISSRHPDHGDVAGKCDDGRGRCERARTDVADRCG